MINNDYKKIQTYEEDFLQFLTVLMSNSLVDFIMIFSQHHHHGDMGPIMQQFGKI